MLPRTMEDTDIINDLCLHTGFSEDVVVTILDRLLVDRRATAAYFSEEEPDDPPETLDAVNDFLLEKKGKIVIEAKTISGAVLRIDVRDAVHRVRSIE